MADTAAKLMSDERRLSQLKLPLITFSELGKKLFNDWSELAAELGIDADEVRHKAITQTDGALARELVNMLQKRDVVVGKLCTALDRMKRRDIINFLSEDVTKYSAAKATDTIPLVSPDSALKPIDLSTLVHPDMDIEIPAVEDVHAVDPDQSRVDLLLMVVTRVEFFAVMRKLEPLPGRACLLRVTPNHDAYVLGVFGVYRVALVQCDMGGGEPGGAQQVANYALQFWRPKAVIMIGIAFGLQPAKQRFGDVLVSSQLASYDLQRITGTEERVTQRGTIKPSGAHLSPRFRDVGTYDWEFSRRDGTACKVIRGQVLSGSVLADSLTYGQRLLESYPEAIGGEMEGHGLSTACLSEGSQWIVVKAVCDFAGMDGLPKRKDAQPFAAAAATSLVHHVLSRHCLGGLGCVPFTATSTSGGPATVLSSGCISRDQNSKPVDIVKALAGDSVNFQLLILALKPELGITYDAIMAQNDAGNVHKAATMLVNWSSKTPERTAKLTTILEENGFEYLFPVN
mmetsp:Transcript_13441/g.40560  ORF Transcript_13441/g.40560 Transcript_13441/m.40560 type:complete len:514 (-) Transcript_13441:3151-4692(-)